MRLIGVAALCGFFTGARGGLFSVAMWRLNVRLRQTLFEALLRQEQGFYDTVQTGAHAFGGAALWVVRYKFSIVQNLRATRSTLGGASIG